MKHWTIGRRIGAGFSLVILIVLGLGGFALSRLVPINTSSKRIVEDCLPGVATIGEWQSRLKENRALVQHFLLTELGPAKEKIGGEIRANVREIDRLSASYEKTLSQAEGRSLFAALQSLRQPFDVSFQKVLDLSSADKSQDAMELFMGQLVPQYGQYFSAVERQVKYNRDQAELARVQIARAIEAARLGILIGCTASFVIATLLAYFIISSTTRALTALTSTLEESTGGMATASDGFYTGSQSLAESASQQAASLEETSASLEEISAMTKRNSDNAASSKALSREARDSAADGLERISELGKTLTSVKGAVREMESAVSEMQSSSQEIAKIIRTIDEIAFQTNLLALNAAVEAARAGEAGAGFAVVADEVRSLAQRSAQAAKDTSEKIDAAVKRSALGGTASKKVVQSLGEIEGSAKNIEQVFNGIVTQIRSLDEIVGEISAASKEQSQGISEVNMAVGQMDKVTQTNASAAEENASAAEELNAQAGILRNAVTELQTLIVGSLRIAHFENPSPSPTSPSSRLRAKSSGARAAHRAAPTRNSNQEMSRDGFSTAMAEPISGQGGPNGFRDF